MKERPILFSGEMVRAILGGRKTQTRRIVKLPFTHSDWEQAVQIPDDWSWIFWDKNYPGHVDFTARAYRPGDGVRCPYGQPGDRLWVRETWGAVSPDEEWAPLRECRIEYRADLPTGSTDYPGGWPAEEARGNDDAPKWRPSIYMPRWASRITLEITGVRVQRVQEISDNDVIEEGVQILSEHLDLAMNYQDVFQQVWDAINKKRGFGWIENPWVWVIEFERLQGKKNGV